MGVTFIFSQSPSRENYDVLDLVVQSINRSAVWRGGHEKPCDDVSSRGISVEELEGSLRNLGPEIPRESIFVRAGAVVLSERGAR